MKETRIPPSSGSAKHPSPEALFEAAAGGGDAAARSEIQRHAAVCSDCSAELAHLEAFRTPAPVRRSELDAAWGRFQTGRTGLQAGRKGRVARRSPIWVLAAAALAIGVAIPILRRGVRVATPPETERGAPNGVELVSPRGDLPAPPAEFVFRGPSHPVRVTVFDSSRTFDWTSVAASGGRVAFPESERRRLEEGRSYLWTIVGTDGPAPVATFRIAPGAAVR